MAPRARPWRDLERPAAEPPPGVRCRACGAERLAADRLLGGLAYARCRRCGGVQCLDGGLLDYAAAPAYNDAAHLAYELDCGAGLYFFAHLLHILRGSAAARRPGGPPPRLLEAGGGFGFVSHMAGLLFGWETMNVDPSGRAPAGAAALGIPARRGTVSRERDGGGYDAVAASEVIEHVADPVALVRSLAACLAPGGLLLLTTPNARPVALGAAPAADYQDILEAYSPGQHYTLFSRRGLAAILERAGLAATVAVREGRSGRKRLIALARPGGRRPRMPPPPARSDLDRLFLDYAVPAAALPGADPLLARYRHGLCFRMFETRVNRGEYARAAELAAGTAAERGLDALVAGMEDGRGAADFAAFMAEGPAFAGVYRYYRGMLALNHEGDAARAAGWFGAAERRLRRQQRLFPAATADIIGLALAHEVLALTRLGQARAARSRATLLARLPYVPDWVLRRAVVMGVIPPPAPGSPRRSGNTAR